MDRISTKQLATLPIEFKLNGKTVIGRPDEPIIETARQNGISIPHLCYSRTLRPDGNCRACVVEIKGERVLAPSCCRYPTQGMEVTTDSPRALASQKVVLELLLADMPAERHTLASELDRWATALPSVLTFGRQGLFAHDNTHHTLAMAYAAVECLRPDGGFDGERWERYREEFRTHVVED